MKGARWVVRGTAPHERGAREGFRSRAGWLGKPRRGWKKGQEPVSMTCCHLEAGSHVPCAALAYRRCVVTHEEEFPKDESNSHVNTRRKRCVFYVNSH